MVEWNAFRYLADISHTLSKCILIWAIHRNSSAEGVSLLTQIYYLVVFLARYVPQPWFPKEATTWHLIWNTTLKLFFIGSSAYTILIMTKVYARTREREVAAKIGWWAFGGALVISPFVMLIFDKKLYWSFREWCWVFSIALESVVVLPQLLLLRQTQVPTVLDSFYLVMLGLYRFFYLLNWLYRAVREKHWDPISVIFGLIQTLFYIDFAYVYWSRQRVKLRGGAVVDSDDFRNGWLVKRLLGRRTVGNEEADDEEAVAPDGPRNRNNKWGSRGISVSADDGVYEAQSSAEINGLADPAAFEDNDSDEETGAPKTKKDAATSASAGDRV